MSIYPFLTYAPLLSFSSKRDAYDKDEDFMDDPDLQELDIPTSTSSRKKHVKENEDFLFDEEDFNIDENPIEEDFAQLLEDDEDENFYFDE